MNGFFLVVLFNTKMMSWVPVVLALEQLLLGNVLYFFKTNWAFYPLKPLLVDAEAEREVFLFFWLVLFLFVILPVNLRS